MLRLSINKQILLTTIGIIGGILVIYIGVLLPTAREINALGASIADTEQTLEQNYQRGQLLKKSLRELSDITQKMQTLSLATAEANTELSIITHLEEIAEYHQIAQTIDLSIVNTPQVPGGGTPKPHYIFSMQQTGTFENLMAYLTALEEDRTYYVIERLVWSTANDNNLSLTFQAKIYMTETII
jgi:hypothetical protein